MVGIELDQAVPDGHDGRLNNTQHFTCYPGHGMYVRPVDVLEVLTSLEFNIYCKGDADSFGYARVHSCVVDRYVFRKSINLSIYKSLQVPFIKKGAKRQLHIQSMSDITVLPNVVIKGNGTETLRMGGMIRMISMGTVTNHGTLCCNGMTLAEGGAIHIVADSFVNKGSIECVPNGQIKIYCRKYQNDGTIRPEPSVIYSEKTSRHLTNLADYPLSVIDYLMHSLQFYDKCITIPIEFYKLIGVEQLEVVDEWIPWIARHKLLFDVSRFEDMLLIERLRSELKLHILPPRDYLLNHVSLGDTLNQAKAGVEAFDRMREVIRDFSEQQQSKADHLQQKSFIRLPSTYRDFDGMKGTADVYAHVHELILETVAAQKRMADVLVKEIVPQMDAIIKVCI